MVVQVNTTNNKEQNQGSSLREIDSSNIESQKSEVAIDVKSDVSEVSDFMDGIDTPVPSEKVSKTVREDDKKQQGTKGKAQSNDASIDANLQDLSSIKIPSQKVMIRQIRKELNREIEALIKQAKREEKKGPYYLSEILHKIRHLRGILLSLANNTYEFIKDLYVSLFIKKNDKIL